MYTKFYIHKYNSLYPNGYNLKNGGNVFKHTETSKKRVSDGVKQYYNNNISKKINKFRNVKNICTNYDKYIRPLNRFGTQYGWYVYIEGNKVDFGGVHLSLDDSYQRAIQFIELLKKESNSETP